MKSEVLGVVIAILVVVTIAPVTAAKPKEKPAATAAKPAPGGTLLSMKQVTIPVDPAGDPKANGAKIAAFQTATLGIFSCDDVADVAQGVGATVATNDRLPFASLPPALQATVETMKIGTATQLFGDRQTGTVSVLVLCARK